MRAPRIWEDHVCDADAAARLAAELQISPITARLLCQRGFSDPDEARRFLSPSLSDLHDPFTLKDMAAVVERVLGAIARKERIAIHGDYDVDGVTSTVILRRALELLGAEAGDAAYIGDSPFDIAAAQAAGVFSVWVSWGGIHDEQRILQGTHPDATVHTAEELLAVLA